MVSPFSFAPSPQRRRFGSRNPPAGAPRGWKPDSRGNWGLLPPGGSSSCRACTPCHGSPDEGGRHDRHRYRNPQGSCSSVLFQNKVTIPHPPHPLQGGRAVIPRAPRRSSARRGGCSFSRFGRRRRGGSTTPRSTADATRWGTSSSMHNAPCGMHDAPNRPTRWKTRKNANVFRNLTSPSGALSGVRHPAAPGGWEVGGMRQGKRFYPLRNGLRTGLEIRKRRA